MAIVDAAEHVQSEPVWYVTLIQRSKKLAGYGTVAAPLSGGVTVWAAEVGYLSDGSAFVQGKDDDGNPVEAVISAGAFQFLLCDRRFKGFEGHPMTRFLDNAECLGAEGS